MSRSSISWTELLRGSIFIWSSDHGHMECSSVPTVILNPVWQCSFQHKWNDNVKPRCKINGGWTKYGERPNSIPSFAIQAPPRSTRRVFSWEAGGFHEGTLPVEEAEVEAGGHLGGGGGEVGYWLQWEVRRRRRRKGWPGPTSSLLPSLWLAHLISHFPTYCYLTISTKSIISSRPVTL